MYNPYPIGRVIMKKLLMLTPLLAGLVLLPACCGICGKKKDKAPKHDTHHTTKNGKHATTKHAKTTAKKATGTAKKAAPVKPQELDAAAY